MKLVYSQSRVELKRGESFRNPRFYGGPEGGVRSVRIVGDWPRIAAEYRAVGAEVAIEGREEAAQPAPFAMGLAQRQDPTAPIPDDWRDLPWTGPADKLTLRQLAAMVSDTPVINKAQAIEAIEAELARRAQA